MRESRTYGSARGPGGNPGVYSPKDEVDAPLAGLAHEVQEGQISERAFSGMRLCLETLAKRGITVPDRGPF